MFADRSANASSATSVNGSINEVISAIDVNRVAGDKACNVVCQKGRCGADVLDAHKAARGGLGLGFFE
jgi:hypothetical protein